MEVPSAVAGPNAALAGQAWRVQAWEEAMPQGKTASTPDHCTCRDSRGHLNNSPCPNPRAAPHLEKASEVSGKPKRGDAGRFDIRLLFRCRVCAVTWHVVERRDWERTTYRWLRGEQPASAAGAAAKKKPAKKKTAKKKTAKKKTAKKKTAKKKSTGRGRTAVAPRGAAAPCIPGVDLPAVGSLFGVPLADGRFGACWVLRHQPKGADGFATARGKGDLLLVQTSAWIGEDVPSLTAAGLRRALKVTKQGHLRTTPRLWVHEAPPADYVYVGARKPSAAQARLSSERYGQWTSVGSQRLTQWRWVHDREALLAERAARRQQAELEKQRERLNTLTLSGLARKPFSTWDGRKPRTIVIAARRIVRDTVTSLRALGASPRKRSVMSLIKRAVLGFNALALELDGAMDLREGQDIETCLFELAYVCGARTIGDDEVTKAWRAW